MDQGFSFGVPKGHVFGSGGGNHLSVGRIIDTVDGR